MSQGAIVNPNRAIPRFRLNNVTPFTYRDGLTFLELIEELREWATSVFPKEIEGIIEVLVAELEGAGEQYEAGVDEFQRIHDAFMADVNAHLVALNDSAISDLLDDPESFTRIKLDSVTEDAVATLVESPTSDTRASLDANFVRSVSLSRVNGTRAELQAAIDEACAKNLALHLYGSYALDGSLTVPGPIAIIGIGQPVITQTAALTPHIVFEDLARVHVEGVKFVGLGTDYVDTDLVYGATALRFFGANGRITVRGVTVENIAGAGIFVTSGASQHVTIEDCVITGVGHTVTGARSGGILVRDGIEDVTISGCNISEIGQGIGIGHGSARIKITGNTLHHTSEHGGYFAVSDDYIITNNHFYDTGLLGFKIQRGFPGTTCKSAVITDNIFHRTGSTSVTITNANIGTDMFIENVVIANNVITDSGDTGFRIDHAAEVSVVGNVINGARFGIRVFDSTGITLRANSVRDTERPGMWLENVTDCTVSDNRLLNLGLDGPEKVGIMVRGITADISLTDNRIDHTTPAHTDGILLSASGTFTGVQLVGNHSRAANWAYRISGAVAAITEWRNNTGTGGLGLADTYPATVPDLPPSSGADLAALETEVNKIKTILRDQRDAR